MNETAVLAEMKLADLSAYLVARYGMTPRDATGLVMQSPVAERLREENSAFLNYSVEQLAAQMI
jgi:hypothetical protein